MVPRRVIPHVLIYHTVDPVQLILARLPFPQPEVLHEPLAITPDMVVLVILREHDSNEVCLSSRVVELSDYSLTVVPDLVVFQVFERGAIEPLDFFLEVGVNLGEGFGPIEPVK